MTRSSDFSRLVVASISPIIVSLQLSSRCFLLSHPLFACSSFICPWRVVDKSRSSLGSIGVTNFSFFPSPNHPRPVSLFRPSSFAFQVRSKVYFTDSSARPIIPAPCRRFLINRARSSLRAFSVAGTPMLGVSPFDQPRETRECLVDGARMVIA